MRLFLAASLVTTAIACGGTISNGDDTDGDGGGGKTDACVGLECDIVNCAAMSMPPTKITGKVYAPNGTLPLYGANVYIPRDEVPAFTEGAECTRCNPDLPGSPIRAAVTNEAGEFTLEDVPVGGEIPVVIALGKWRRQIKIPVTQCADNPLGPTETSLPKNKMQGDIPKIAITTGDADALECLLPKLGIDVAEVTNANGNGRIHLYSGDGANSLASGGQLTAAGTLWNSPDALKSYDIVIMSCEGSQLPNNNGGTQKTQDMLNNVKAYADLGGRVFLSHWHNIWVSGKFQGGVGAPTPPVWKDIGTWSSGDDPGAGTVDTIDEIMNPKGPSFATWMQNVGGSPMMRGAIPIRDGSAKQTATSIDPAKAERWVYLENGNNDFPQNFQFTTPNEAPADTRCGKVVFSDMHVSGGQGASTSSPGTPFPGGCTADLTEQEKALAFMFFDIATCVGGIL